MITVRGLSPNKGSRSSFREGNLAGTAVRFDADRSRMVDRAYAPATCERRQEVGRFCANCKGSRPQPHSPRSSNPLWSGESHDQRSDLHVKNNIGRRSGREEKH